MPVRIAVPKESAPGERRTAINPEVAKKLEKLGAAIIVEAGLGATAGFEDSQLGAAEIAPTTAAALSQGDMVFKVQIPTEAEIEALKPGAVLVSAEDPTMTLSRLKGTSAAHRLISPSEMGELFKVLGIGKGLDVPLQGFQSARHLQL